MLALASASLSFNVGAPAHSVVVRTPTVHMNEAAAKAAWLAKSDTPSWGPPTAQRKASRASIGRIAPTSAADSDDHTNPGARSTMSGPTMGKVPIATWQPGNLGPLADDHTNPGARSSLSGPSMGRVPIATAK